MMPVGSDLAGSLHGVANDRQLFVAWIYSPYTCTHVGLPELLHSLHKHCTGLGFLLKTCLCYLFCFGVFSTSEIKSSEIGHGSRMAWKWFTYLLLQCNNGLFWLWKYYEYFLDPLEIVSVLSVANKCHVCAESVKASATSVWLYALLWKFILNKNFLL